MKCKCGQPIQRVSKDVTHILFGKSITISNVPHFICNTCEVTEYENELKVNHLLRDAYREHATSVSY